MRKWSQNLLYAILALTSVYNLVSCTPKTAKSGVSPAVVPLPQSGQNSNSVPRGTSDSGGGTGVEGKIFESYIVDPTALPAYKQYIQPLLKNIKSHTQESFEFDRLFKIKTWYIAPVTLNKVAKDSLGLEFIASDTQQIARQSMKEVWINKHIFDEMTSKDQADLLLHEMIMSLYFLKFVKFSELCKMSDAIFMEEENSDCAEFSEILDRMMPPEEFKPLNEQDNENIRFVTGWLSRNAQVQISEKDFYRVLLYKGFDQRLFSLDSAADSGSQSSEEFEQVTISRKDFLDAIKGAEASGHMPKACVALDESYSKDCQVLITEKLVSLQKTEVPGFQLQISIAEEPSLAVDFLVAEQIQLSISKDSDGRTIYVFLFAEWRDQVKFGDRLHSGVMFFKRVDGSPNSPFVLESLSVNPGIVVSIDKNRDSICQLRSPKATQFLDRPVSARQSNSALSLVERKFSMITPFAACTEHNIQD